MRLPRAAAVLHFALAMTAGASQAAGPSAPMPHASMPHARMPRARPQPVEHYVDLNSASRKELMTLPGIGREEADKIVAHRPYLTKNELVTKGVLPTGPFLSIRNQVVAMQKLPAPPKPAASAAARSAAPKSTP